jgi:hypothetical protein
MPPARMQQLQTLIKGYVHQVHVWAGRKPMCHVACSM